MYRKYEECLRQAADCERTHPPVNVYSIDFLSSSCCTTTGSRILLLLLLLLYGSPCIFSYHRLKYSDYEYVLRMYYVAAGRREADELIYRFSVQWLLVGERVDR